MGSLKIESFLQAPLPLSRGSGGFSSGRRSGEMTQRSWNEICMLGDGASWNPSSTETDGLRILNQVAKLVDFKTMVKLPEFDGGQTGWSEFRFKIEGLADLLGIAAELRVSLTAPEDSLTISNLEPGTAVKAVSYTHLTLPTIYSV